VPELVLFCGLPASGKTTNAKLLESRGRYVRICTDEWKADLGADLFDEVFRGRIEQLLWRHALRLLQLGNDLILENGFWSREERSYVLEMAHAMDVSVTMVYLPVPLDELKTRMAGRNLEEEQHGRAMITADQLDTYSGMFEAPTEEELARYDKVLVGGITA
jgi:predicted kinase